jgi:hypothetical protein
MRENDMTPPVTRHPDLLSWVRAQVDEDERIALALETGPVGNPSPWQKRLFGLRSEGIADRHGSPVILFVHHKDPTHMVVDHILNHDPTRALREVAAKRAILDEYAEADTYYTANVSAPAGELHGLRTAVLAIAAIYEGRPGWREEWTA